MKRLAIILVAVGWLGCVSKASAQAFVQTIYGSSLNAGTSFGSITVTAGNMLVVTISCASSSDCAPTIADSQTNTWTGNLKTCTTFNASNGPAYSFAAYNAKGGATVVTITTGASSGEGYLTEYSGLAASAAFDQGACQQQVNQNPSTSGNTSATSTANELVVGFISINNSTRTAGSGFTGRSSDIGNFFDGLEDKNVTSTGVQAATFGTSGSSTGGVLVLTFKTPPAALSPQSGGQLISAPLLPQAIPTIVYPSEAGYTVTPVASGANLQTAITGATCGTILSLAHGGSWSASSLYDLPLTNCTCHTNPAKWVILRSDAFVGGSTRGVRVDPSAEYANLAHISNTDPNYAISAAHNQSSCYWLLGLDVTQNTSPAQSVITIGDGTQTIANYPHDFVIDHSYIHGIPTQGMVRCILADGNFFALVDSYISDCHKIGQDTQALGTFEGIGGFLIQNNFLEGAAENYLIGGTTTQFGNNMCDVTFIGNHFFKPLSWRQSDPTYSGIHWEVKNNFEMKGGCRFLITGNVMDNNWADGQSGQIWAMRTSTNNWSIAHDVTAYYNIVRNGTGVFVFDCDGAYAPYWESVHRMYLHDNLAYNIDARIWGSSNGRDVYIGGKCGGEVFAPFDIWYIHNTIDSANLSQGEGVILNNAAVGDLLYGLQMRNNVIDRSAFGAFYQAGVGPGDLAVNSSFPSGPVTKLDYNCIYGPSVSDNYTNAVFANSQFITAGDSGVFVNPGVDFHIAPSSACHNAASDGIDIGANINSVNTATSNTVQTLTNMTTVTNVNPSTFTHTGGTGITITGTNFIVNSGSGESGIGVIIGGAGPSSNVSTVSCTVNTCTVVMSQPITLAVNDTIGVPWVSGYQDNNANHLFTVASVTDTTHFTYTSTGIGTQSWSGGTIHRYTPGNACTSVSVVSATSITCTTPAATGTVTTGPVSVFVSQFGIPIQSTVFPSYN